MERRFLPHDSTESRPHSQTAYGIEKQIHIYLVATMKKKTSYRFTWSQTIFDITLEYNAVALGESERFVDGLQCIAVRCECWENGRIHWTTIVVNDLECTL